MQLSANPQADNRQRLVKVLDGCCLRLTEHKIMLLMTRKCFNITEDTIDTSLRRDFVCKFLHASFEHRVLGSTTAELWAGDSSSICMSPTDGSIILCCTEAVPGRFDITNFVNAVREWISWCTASVASSSAAPISAELDNELMRNWRTSEDEMALRVLVEEAGGIAFISNGALIPCVANSSSPISASIFASYSQANVKTDRSDMVEFTSPLSMQVSFTLPHCGEVTGMLMPKGVTVIAGGGFHGKSTFLNALKMGIQNKRSHFTPSTVGGFVVTIAEAFTVRSEDLRPVGGIDISAFVSELPPRAGVDPTMFCTRHASGSTSMAAGVIEACEMGAKALLLDEDTCAGNFLIRDSRLRSLVGRDPITPLIYRINALYEELGVSSVIVIGGAGDWFDVQDTTFLMDNYVLSDVTKRARSISKTFCTGRVEYNGRGLVHRLPWPAPVRPRALDLSSFFHSPLVEAGVVTGATGVTRERGKGAEAGTEGKGEAGGVFGENGMEEEGPGKGIDEAPYSLRLLLAQLSQHDPSSPR